MLRITGILISTALSIQVIAQKADLYLVDFHINPDSSYNFSNVRYASDFNPDGYNNQPFFSDPTNLYISSDSYGNGTDIVKLDLRSGSLQRITSNPEAEYSPQLHSEDRYLSCILVDSSGDQILWSYALDSNDIDIETLNIEPLIGYYAFVDSQHIAFFQLGDPHKLMVHNRADEQMIMINADIGRCLKVPAPGSLLYVHKYADDFWVLKKWNVADKRASIVKKMIPGSEDFELLDENIVIASKGNKLYKLENDQWTEWLDLSPYGLNNVTRIAFNGRNTLALVNVPE